ncbi:MAG: group II intron reverse transcriptase domain-containing protein [Candidatus Doudnabacteria bacterium]|nr:group II intron reverse transcriptase domain-containing protein [Candidatus Doudnabacteria bacterium]
MTKLKTQLQIAYQEIISLENLFAAWQEFLPGKRKKKDVQEFGLRLADNILQLQGELANFSYVHGSYKAFNISDPKPRNIHKASVRDRVLHHAIYRQLYPFFNKTFIADSYSCRNGKGTHKALDRFREFGRKVGKNNTRTAWILKCDIKKFFASIDHGKLLEILEGYIPDKDILWLLNTVVESFTIQPHLSLGCTRDTFSSKGEEGCYGLPLGNLTSQLFCNVYMNEFDQFVKHKLKSKFYIRYADDFVFLSYSHRELKNLVPKISAFLHEELKLTLHPGKVFVKTLASGVDFLGWVYFPHHSVLRRTTGKRMFKRVYQDPQNEILQSYLGFIRHGDTYKIKQKLLNWYGLLAKNVEPLSLDALE